MLNDKRKIQGDSKPRLMELPARPKPCEAQGLPFDHVSLPKGEGTSQLLTVEQAMLQLLTVGQQYLSFPYLLLLCIEIGRTWPTVSEEIVSITVVTQLEEGVSHICLVYHFHGSLKRAVNYSKELEPTGEIQLYSTVIFHTSMYAQESFSYQI